MNKITKAQNKLANFNPRGSLCPVCGRWFRGCPHSVDLALRVLQRRVVEQVVSTAIKKQLDHTAQREG